MNDLIKECPRKLSEIEFKVPSKTKINSDQTFHKVVETVITIKLFILLIFKMPCYFNMIKQIYNR